MVRTSKCLVGGVLLGLLVSVGYAKDYPYRWVFVGGSLRSDKDVAAIEQIVQTGSEYGINGMVLSTGLDRLDRQPQEYLGRLAKLKEFSQTSAPATAARCWRSTATSRPGFRLRMRPSS
jgi:hypothetical protein